MPGWDDDEDDEDGFGAAAAGSKRKKKKAAQSVLSALAEIIVAANAGATTSSAGATSSSAGGDAAASSFLQALAAADAISSDFSDGSIESAFVCKFPLDGSPVAGSDVADTHAARKLMSLSPQLFQMLGMFGGMPGISHEAAQARLMQMAEVPPCE